MRGSRRAGRLGDELLEVLPGELVDGVSRLLRSHVLEEVSAVPTAGEGDGGRNYAQQRRQDLTRCLEGREEGVGDDLAGLRDRWRLLLQQRVEDEVARHCKQQGAPPRKQRHDRDDVVGGGGLATASGHACPSWLLLSRILDCRLHLSSGMAVSEDIKTGRRTVAAYFLAPLLNAGEGSLHERQPPVRPTDLVLQDVC